MSVLTNNLRRLSKSQTGLVVYCGIRYSSWTHLLVLLTYNASNDFGIRTWHLLPNLRPNRDLSDHTVSI